MDGCKKGRDLKWWSSSTTALPSVTRMCLLLLSYLFTSMYVPKYVYTLRTYILHVDWKVNTSGHDVQKMTGQSSPCMHTTRVALTRNHPEHLIFLSVREVPEHVMYHGRLFHRALSSVLSWPVRSHFSHGGQDRRVYHWPWGGGA